MVVVVVVVMMELRVKEASGGCCRRAGGGEGAPLYVWDGTMNVLVSYRTCAARLHTFYFGTNPASSQGHGRAHSLVEGGKNQEDEETAAGPLRLCLSAVGKWNRSRCGTEYGVQGGGWFLYGGRKRKPRRGEGAGGGWETPRHLHRVRRSTAESTLVLLLKGFLLLLVAEYGDTLWGLVSIFSQREDGRSCFQFRL